MKYLLHNAISNVLNDAIYLTRTDIRMNVMTNCQCYSSLAHHQVPSYQFQTQYILASLIPRIFRFPQS